MKIIHIARFAAPEVVGGIENMVANLAEAQAAEGNDVEVVAFCRSGKPRRFNHRGYKIRLFQSQITVASVPFSIDFLSFIFRNRKTIDVVNVHVPFPSADICLLLCGLTRKTIVTYHSDIVRQTFARIFYQPLLLVFLFKAHAIAATSPNYINSSNILKLFSKKVVPIPIGIKDVNRRGYKVSEDLNKRPFVLFVGELRYYKGLETLLRAANKVDCDIVVAGSGPMGGTLRKIAKNLGLTNVIFRGRVSETEKNKLLAQSKAVVLPSHLRSEAFGVILLEGAAFAKPLISCEINTGTSFVNVHGKTGIVIKPNDPLALASAIQKIMQNQCLANEYGANARHRFEQFFQADLMTEKYRSLYESCVK